MSFDDMKRPELEKVAETFGIEIPPGKVTDKNLRALLDSEGVTREQWDELQAEFVEPEVEPEVPEVPEEDEVEELVQANTKFKTKNQRELLKMERQNRSFQILGYKFTKEHPFVLMKPDDATWIMSHETGFRLASPDEAREFYGK
jgi:hypothetical protein